MLFFLHFPNGLYMMKNLAQCYTGIFYQHSCCLVRMGLSMSLYFGISISHLMLKSCHLFLPSSSKRRGKVHLGKLWLCETGQMYQLQCFLYCTIWWTRAMFLLRVLRVRYRGSARWHTSSLGVLGVPVWLYTCVQGWALIVKEQFTWVFKCCLCFQCWYYNNIFHFLTFFLFYKKEIFIGASTYLFEDVYLYVLVMNMWGPTINSGSTLKWI